MKIQELLEAVAPIGTTTDPVSPNGLPKTTAPAPTQPGQQPIAGQQPPVAGQAPVPGQVPPVAPGQQPAPTLGNQQAAGQPAPPPAALQQGMKSTMTDLDKIAAQIVGLKQKQQQMQQQMQPTV
jgi:hypothetical protein